MNKQEIMELLNIGENREVEFKESYKKITKITMGNLFIFR